MKEKSVGWGLIILGLFILSPGIILLDPQILSSVAIPGGAIVGLGIGMVT